MRVSTAYAARANCTDGPPSAATADARTRRATPILHHLGARMPQSHPCAHNLQMAATAPAEMVAMVLRRPPASTATPPCARPQRAARRRASAAPKRRTKCLVPLKSATRRRREKKRSVHTPPFPTFATFYATRFVGCTRVCKGLCVHTTTHTIRCRITATTIVNAHISSSRGYGSTVQAPHARPQSVAARGGRAEPPLRSAHEALVSRPCATAAE